MQKKLKNVKKVGHPRFSDNPKYPKKNLGKTQRTPPSVFPTTVHLWLNPPFFTLQASMHLSNHAEELNQKILSVLSVVEAILQQYLSTWTPSLFSLPSANFRALCKQVIIVKLGLVMPTLLF
jgi:hypothetical protein